MRGHDMRHNVTQVSDVAHGPLVIFIFNVYGISHMINTHTFRKKDVKKKK
jgi:hypothetical protein